MTTPRPFDDDPTSQPVETLTALPLMGAGLHSLFDIRNLNRCAALLSLNLHCNSIHKIENLAGCRSLTELNLSANAITAIDGLDALHHLVELNLASNRVCAPLMFCLFDFPFDSD